MKGRQFTGLFERIMRNRYMHVGKEGNGKLYNFTNTDLCLRNISIE